MTLPGSFQAALTLLTMTYLFIDCDDTLYRDDWMLANVLTERINSYATKVLNLPHGKAYELYKKHGTCLRGLQVENYEFDVEDFLFSVHADLPIKEHIKPNEALKQMLSRIHTNRVRTCIFTASVREHAVRCTTAVDVYDSFFKDKPIIDVRSVNFYTKHDPEALEYAQDIMNCPREQPQQCILVDDSQTNIRVAKLAGWQTVLIGHHSRDGKSQRAFEYADFVIDKLTDLEKTLPELFRPEKKTEECQ
jgi:pyrimidine 5'-nucleotidase